MEFLSTHSHNLVIDAGTRLPILSEDKKLVLLNSIKDDSLHFYALEAVEKVFCQIQTVEPAVIVNPKASTFLGAPIYKIDDNFNDMPSTSKNTEERFRITWAQQDILKLINIYKDHASLFKSPKSMLYKKKLKYVR